MEMPRGSADAGRRAAVALAALAVAAAACGGKPELAALPPPEVVVEQPVERPVTEYYETTGRTAAVEEVEIRARVPGYLVKIGFEDGAEVKAGDVLFEIDPRPYEAAVHNAEGALARWEAQLRKAEAEVARNQRLRPTGAASERELETAIAGKETAQAEIVSARAVLENARLDLEFARIVAPIDGRASRTAVTAGNLIQLGGASGSTGSTGSTALTTIVRLEPIYVYFDVDERTLLRVRERDRAAGRPRPPGDVRALNVPVEIGIGGDEGYGAKGRLDFVDNRVDPSTGTIAARGVFANADRLLTPGMFVRVRVPLAEQAQALLVPSRAVGTDQGGKYLLVVNDENVVEFRPVRLGVEAEGFRLVEQGLAPGERVITSGIQRVRPGLTVTPQRAAETPAGGGTPPRAPAPPPA